MSGDLEYKALVQEGFSGTLDDVRLKFYSLGATQRLFKAIGAKEGLVYQGIWASRPLSGLTIGDRAEFTNIGNGVEEWFWDGTRWHPVNPIVVYENTSIITGVQQTADQILLVMPFPAGLLTNRYCKLFFSAGRDSTTDAYGSAFTVRVGLAGTLGDTVASTANLGASITGTVRSLGIQSDFLFSNSTTFLKPGTANAAQTWAGAASGGTLNATATVPNVDSNAVFISLSTTMAGATTRPQIGYTRLEIM